MRIEEMSSKDWSKLFYSTFTMADVDPPETWKEAEVVLKALEKFLKGALPQEK